MDCVFVCVFHQEKYVDMFYIFLESLLTYGQLSETTHILIYTSTVFMNMIKQNPLFNHDKMRFEINDTYNNSDTACKSRLDLFEFPSVSNYNKILYLDTDIIVKDDLNKVFDVCTDDLLYVLGEGKITDNDNYYGGIRLFGDEIHNYSEDNSAFSSGILLLKNCEKMRFLFNEIKKDIIARPHYFQCFDQPYIVYNAFKYQVYDNKKLKTYAVNNDNNIYSNKIIHHFPFCPGVFKFKIENLTHFLHLWTFKTPTNLILINL